jgi:acyl carrier protein
MTRDEIRNAVLEILGDISDDDLPEIDDSESLRAQLDMDSMDFLDIVMELRKRYRVTIPEEDYPQLASMQSTVDYLEPRMKDL